MNNPAGVEKTCGRKMRKRGVLIHLTYLAKHIMDNQRTGAQSHMLFMFNPVLYELDHTQLPDLSVKYRLNESKNSIFGCVQLDLKVACVGFSDI